MHSAKEDRRQNDRGYLCMSGLSDDDSANENERAFIGSGERVGQRSPTGIAKSTLVLGEPFSLQRSQEMSWASDSLVLRCGGQRLCVHAISCLSDPL